MLEIRDLTIRLLEDNRVIIKEFNLTLNAFDKVGLIGEEGNGKSILLNTIADKEKVEKYCDINGSIYKNNEVIGYLPQSLGDEDAKTTTNEYLYKHISFDMLDYNKLYRYLKDFDLPDDILSYYRNMGSLSGGEKIKFMLICQMLREPTVFLFDEPSNDLDYDSLVWLENFMLSLQLPYIFVSHDTNLLSNVANRIIHLEQIRRRSLAKHTISNNTYDDYVSRREDFITSEVKKSNKEREEFDKKIERYKRVHDSVQHDLRATKNDLAGRNLKDKMHSIKAIGKRLEKEKVNLTIEPEYEESIDIFFDNAIRIPNGKRVLDFRLDKLSVGDKILSKSIHLQIIGPEKICIMGKNGVGKTTLIKEIIKDCENINLKVGYMPQSYFEYEKANMTALEYLSTTKAKSEHIKSSNILASLSFKREEMYRKISDLSGGQKAKLFFAKMNLDKAEILILDEPTRNISPLSKPEIIDALKDYKGTIIAVSHDREFIDQVFEKVYELTSNGLILKF